MISGAWHAALFERQEKLKPLRDILDRKPERPQTDEELWHAMNRWAAIHNARYEQEMKNG